MINLLMIFLFFLLVGVAAGNVNLRRENLELRKQVEAFKNQIAEPNASAKVSQPLEVPPPPLIPDEDNAAP